MPREVLASEGSEEREVLLKGRLRAALLRLNDSGNVFIMVDEAHRTQYGVLGSLMSRALPNAVMIGFTGNPIDKGCGRSTMKRFGPQIHSYTIPQFVADGATVPIWYEARLPELAVEGPTTLDSLFDAMFGEKTDSVREEIRRRYANRETVAGASTEWKGQYAKCMTIERLNSRLKRSRGLEPHRIRGLRRARLHVCLSLLIYQATALARIETGGAANLRKMRV